MRWWTMLFFASLLGAAEPVPVSVLTAPGRVEVSAIDASVAHRLATIAEETWRALEGPLGLPGAFSSPVFVRWGAEETGGGAFRANVEPGGVVSVWIRTARRTGRASELERRALARGLLLRLAVTLHGPERVVVPGWLEAAMAEWCETRVEPARLDALRYESGALAAPGLGEILAWNGGGEGGRTRVVGAVWLMMFLQGESTRAGEWGEFLRRVLGGTETAQALGAAFPGRFANAAERELWWLTGWHQLRRARTLPVLDAANSRAEVAQLARFVFAAAAGETDVVVPLREVLGHGGDVVVAAELRRRMTELGRLTMALHPFYRNAGLSLAAAFEAGLERGAAAKREAAAAQFEQDWSDARELEAASAAALEALERAR